MKYSTLLLLAVAAFVSCTDSTIFPETPMCNDGSRAIVPQEPSETNPTLLTDWENCSRIYLNEVGNSGHHLTVTPPWNDGCTTTLESKFRKDVKKADGWIMLFHTFAGADDENGTSYMCLYNQFSGYVKVFYYSSEYNFATKSVWTVFCKDSETPRSLFCDSEYFSQPIEGDNNYTIWSITADNKVESGQSAIQLGWNGFEFRIGEYNPRNSEGEFKINALNTIYTQFSFNGEESTATTGTITTLNANGKSVADNALVKAVINQTGEQAKGFIDKLAEKHLNKKIFGFNFKNILAKVSAGDYAGAITSGLGSLFKSFVKEDKTVSEVKLQSHGTITLNGSSSTEIAPNIAAIPFNLKSILECDRSAAFDDNIINIASATNSKIELGVWNLKKKPTLYYERYTEFTPYGSVPAFYPGCTFDFYGDLDYPHTHVGDIQVVFNPAIAQYVKSYKVNVGVIDVFGGNRSLNNKGKAMIYYNTANLLKENDGIKVYGVSDGKKYISGVLDLPFDVNLDENTKFYVDWGMNVGGNRAAVITLTMEIDYNGYIATFTESRVYDVVYTPTTNGVHAGQYNDPPNSYILNQEGNGCYGINLY